MGDESFRVTLTGAESYSAIEPKRPNAVPPGNYRVHEGPSGTWLLMRLTPEGKPQGRVLMMGELVHRMTVVEIINLVMSSNWRGELHIVGAFGRRILSIDQGALKQAQTDFEPERIGEVLVKAGLLPQSQLAPLLAQKRPDQRFGQLLVERKLIDQETLFKQLQHQAETIFYASLVEERGMYWFVAPTDDAAAPSTTMHLPIQALLMEGVQRIDEMGLYRERIPHNRFYPVAVPNAPKPKGKGDALDEASLELLKLCDGTRNLDDLARMRGQGEFPIIKAVYNLVRTGQAQLRRGPRLDPKTAQRLVRTFNEIVRDIFMVVATYGSMNATRASLSSWLANSAHAPVLGSEVDVDGTLDFQAVIHQVEKSGSDDPMTALHQALHELAAYALFTASTGLPRKEEVALSRDVNRRLKQLSL